MNIHDSHTRKSLIDLIGIYQFNKFTTLIGYKKLKKDLLIKALSEILLDDNLSLEAGKDYDIHNSVEDLRQALKEPTKIEAISETEFIKISIHVKKLVNYCKSCNYLLNDSLYNSMSEIIDDATYLSKYGNIPTVRRAIKLINRDTKLKEKIELNISPKVKQNMILKEKVANSLKPRFSISRKTHIIRFD